MSPELGKDAHHRPYPMTPQLATSANEIYAHVTATVHKLEDALQANVPDEMVEQFYDYIGRTLISDNDIPLAANTQLLTGYRFIGMLLGQDDLDDHRKLSENATFEHTMFIGTQKLIAANTIRKLYADEVSADTIRSNLEAFVDNVPDKNTQLPSAYHGIVYMSAMLPYLLVSRTDIKPGEVAHYANKLDQAMKANAQRESRIYGSLLANALGDMRTADDALSGGKALRDELLRRAADPRINCFMSSFYTAPTATFISQEISELRRDKRRMTEELDFMMKLAELLDTVPQPTPETPTSEKMSLMSLDELPVHMQVEWEILPPGTNLGDTARAIVAEKQERTNKPFSIDFTRLQALENIQDLVGEEKARYARGSLKKRGVVRDGSQECPDEYILLLIDDPDGSVASVVADSPIVGPHAMYVYRKDTAQKGSDWETVFRLDKPDARRLGARAIKHSVPAGSSLVDTMTNKAMELLTCRPEDFFQIQFNGNRAARIRRISQILIGGETER